MSYSPDVYAETDQFIGALRTLVAHDRDRKEKLPPVLCTDMPLRVDMGPLTIARTIARIPQMLALATSAYIRDREEWANHPQALPVERLLGKI